jgi:hypothetical protein
VKLLLPVAAVLLLLMRTNGRPAAVDESVKADTVALVVALDDSSRKRPSVSATRVLVAVADVMAAPRIIIVCGLGGFGRVVCLLLVVSVVSSLLSVTRRLGS